MNMAGNHRTVPAGLPVWLAPAHRRVCSWVERLPVAPPSFVLSQVLDRVLLQRLPTDARQALAGRCVELRISDLGVRVRLRLTPTGFAPARDVGEPELRIVAPVSSYLRLLRGEDDPDRLFFERALVMEGDTELGLVLKNTLDAIGPLWPVPATPPVRRRSR
ncbi:MAG: SCP2 sterol-binding domain-containing protein [Pseudomonadota bacterium]|nr:SCP2 sterol-binding domain-containing protein [Pseudomonadota bacterium]